MEGRVGSVLIADGERILARPDRGGARSCDTPPPPLRSIERPPFLGTSISSPGDRPPPRAPLTLRHVEGGEITVGPRGGAPAG